MRSFIALALLALVAVASASDVVEVSTGRKLLASCSIGGKKFASCQKVKGGTVGFTKAGSSVSVGFIGGSATGWAGWTIGRPHQSSSAVFNIQGSVSTRTMKGQLAFLITPPSQIKFGSVKGGRSGSKLYATFTVPSSGRFTWAFATGPGNLIQHAGIPRVYAFKG